MQLGLEQRLFRQSRHVLGHEGWRQRSAVATSLGVLVLEDAVIKALRTPAMKNTAPPDRANLLAQAIERGPASVQGRHVLIVDDLWQTGATVRRVAAILIAGGAASVRVLVMTRTR